MKRKTANNDEAAAAVAEAAPLSKKKQSPLLGKPQKFYVPNATAPSDMTREELSAWRKEERRKRNRASAAASRMKTQSKIDELEGQVSHWKSKCEAMQEMMMKLQRQVDMLTRAQSPTAFLDGHASMSREQQQRQHHYLVSPPTSHPNSPSTTSLPEQHPSIVTSISAAENFLALPSLLLSPPSEDLTLLPVENKADITSSHIDESKKHLNMISRQAVKTGANSLMNNMVDNIMPVLPDECDLSVTEEDSSTTKNADDDVVTDDRATPDVMSVEMPSSSSVSSYSSLSSEEDVSSSETASMDDDDDLLNLLAETLDVDFDPNLLCFD